MEPSGVSPQHSLRSEEEPRLTPKMLLLGRGLDVLSPKRRLLADAVGLLLTMSVLVLLAAAFDFERSYAIGYLGMWVVLTCGWSGWRYFRATRRS